MSENILAGLLASLSSHSDKKEGQETCQFNDCEETDVCDSCGWCDDHHHIKIISDIKAGLLIFGKEKSLEAMRQTGIGNTLSGSFLIALVQRLYNSETRFFDEEKAIEFYEILMDAASVFEESSSSN